MMDTDIRMHALGTYTVVTCKSKAGRIARFALGRSLWGFPAATHRPASIR